MAEMVLGPDVTVELIRSMRAEGFFPTPAYIVDLAQTVGELWPKVEVSENGRFEFEIFSPPLSLEFSLIESDVELVNVDDSLVDNAVAVRGKKSCLAFWIMTQTHKRSLIWGG